MDNLIGKKAISTLYNQGIINYADYTKILKTDSGWRAWFAVNSALFGTALILAAVVCFFAYNWAQLGKVLKLALPLVIFLILALTAALRGLDKLSSKVLASAAAFLVGVTCAVFGQVYQTGADAWQLFLTWSIFILPFALLTRFCGMWILFIIVSNIFFMMGPFSFYTRTALAALLCSGFFLISQIAPQGHYLKNNGFARANFLAALSFLAIPAYSFALGNDKAATTAVIYWFFVVGTTWYLIKQKREITLIGANLITAMSTVLCLLIYITNTDNSSFLALWTLISFGLLTVAISKINNYIKGDN